MTFSGINEGVESLQGEDSKEGVNLNSGVVQTVWSLGLPQLDHIDMKGTANTRTDRNKIKNYKKGVQPNPIEMSKTDLNEIRIFHVVTRMTHIHSTQKQVTPFT